MKDRYTEWGAFIYINNGNITVLTNGNGAGMLNKLLDVCRDINATVNSTNNHIIGIFDGFKKTITPVICAKENAAIWLSCQQLCRRRIIFIQDMMTLLFIAAQGKWKQITIAD